MNSRRGFLWQMNPYEQCTYMHCALFACSYWFIFFFILLLLFFSFYFYSSPLLRLFFLFRIYRKALFNRSLPRPFPYIVQYPYINPLMRLIKPSSLRRDELRGENRKSSSSDRDRRDNDKVQIRVGREKKGR